MLQEKSVTHPVIVSPDLYRKGFRDGARSRMSGDHPDYLAGWRMGFKMYRCNIPACQETPLERGSGDELLNPI